MNGTPKVCVANDFRPRVKLSPWPFCKWILAPTEAILANFDFEKMPTTPYFAGRSGWLDTYIKKTIKWGWAGLHFEFMHEQGNSGFAKLSQRIL